MTIDASEVPRVGVVFRPQLPPERLHGFVVSAEAAGLDDVWLWEDCFFEGSMATAGAALAWTASAVACSQPGSSSLVPAEGRGRPKSAAGRARRISRAEDGLGI